MDLQYIFYKHLKWPIFLSPWKINQFFIILGVKIGFCVIPSQQFIIFQLYAKNWGP